MSALDGAVKRAAVEGLVSVELPALLARAKALVREKASVSRVDGEIVGTGRSDYTKANTIYRCRNSSDSFQLIDVPGIEGDEKAYAPLIREALAKAHVVFYVNGTNKKPETDTAEKIGRYLRHDAVVHPVMNVRGKGDTYEFPEDRCSLADTHKDIATNTHLTAGVLSERVGDVVRESVAVQGMVALAALSWSAEGTTIIPERPDLVRTQLALVELFEDRQAMRAFSQIDALADVLVGYAEGGYRTEIEAANRRRLMRRLKETLSDLDACLEWHSSAVELIRGRADKSVLQVRSLAASFRRGLESNLTSELNSIFLGLAGRVEAVIEEFFSSTDTTRSKVDEEVAKHMEQLRAAMEEAVREQLEDFRGDLAEVLKRMEEDIEAQLKAAAGIPSGIEDVSLPRLDLDAVGFQLRDAGGFAARILAYSTAGAAAAAPFGGITALPGALIGAAVGFVMTGLEYLLLGRTKKIRKAQAQALESLDAVKAAAKRSLEEASKGVSRSVEGIIDRVAATIEQQVVILEGAGSVIVRQREHVLAMYQSGEGDA